MKAIFLMATPFLLLAQTTLAGDTKEISLFGSQPLQLSVGSKGPELKKSDGFICDLKAKLSGAKYSEWGQTEADARAIVYQKCGNQSGFALCSKDSAVCRKEN